MSRQHSELEEVLARRLRIIEAREAVSLKVCPIGAVGTVGSSPSPERTPEPFGAKRQASWTKPRTSFSKVTGWATPDGKKKMWVRVSNGCDADASSELVALRSDLQAKRQEAEGLKEERDAALRLVEELRGQVERFTIETTATMSAQSSESNLRAALTKQGGASSEELRTAIGAVAALLEEAQRELAAREHRERRAAYEGLHAASVANDEDVLAKAIETARRTGVDSTDIDKAETKLEVLRAMSPEEKDARRREREIAEAKKQAFLLVRKDRADELRELLGALDDSIDWRCWKDYSGRTLAAYAKYLHVTQVRELFEQPVGKASCFGDRSVADMSEAPESPSATDASTTASESIDRIIVFSEPMSVSQSADSTPTTCRSREEGDYPQTPRRQPRMVSKAESETPRKWAAEDGALSSRSRRAMSVDQSNVGSAHLGAHEASLSKDQETIKQMSCFRAVVQNEAETLERLLKETPVQMWSAWQNKAGKDLVSLSQERGSSEAYAVLARALGIVQERKHAALEEGEAVWVMEAGELQPRRASVVEASAEDAAEVFLVFWDGDAPPSRVPRALVSKAYN